ncbi:MAG TPA: glycosyltransferase [Arcobacter sp.]|nr:glycosyltransferase [Arcobacter sp.]
MNLFYINPMSYNNLGEYDHSLLSNLDNKNGEIYFFSSTNFEFSLDEIKNIPIYNYNNKKSIFKLFSYLYSQITLIFYIKKIKPDVIHFQWFRFSLFDYLVLLIIQIFNKKVKIIYTAHNILPHNQRLFDKYFYKKIYEIVDIVIVHDNRSKEKLFNEFIGNREKIRVIPHGVFQKKENNDDLLPLYEKQKDEIIYAVIGGIGDYKNIEELIKIWLSYDMKKQSKKKLLLAGRFSLKMKKIIQKMEDSKNIICIDRYLLNSEINFLHKISDVVIAAYSNISQSGALMTAIANRIPVIVTNVGGLDEVLYVGNIGWKVDINNLYVELFNLLINMDKKQIKTISCDLPEWENVLSYYSWKNISSSTLKLYEEKK